MAQKRSTILDARNPTVLSDARNFVSDYLFAMPRHPMSDSELARTTTLLAELELAVGEGVANVVRHAAHPPGCFELILDYQVDTVIAVITDYGPGFSLRPYAMPSPLEECGRGVALMQRLCDFVGYYRDCPNQLVLRKRISTLNGLIAGRVN